jgi:hypothetical protein
MKKSLFLYLFIIASLMTLFTFSFYSKQLKFEQQRFEKYQTKMTDSIQSIQIRLQDADYFSIESNTNAQDYLYPNDYIKISTKVSETLIDFNDNPEGNPYTGFDKLGEQKFIINKIKVLNHRWVVADFSDGNLWGNVLIQYFIEEDGSITFKVIQSFLYPKQ